jgi:hypothetical protein
MPETADVRALIEKIAKWIVDAPDEVYVDHLDDDVIELEVAEADVGKDHRPARPKCPRPAYAPERCGRAGTKAIHAGSDRLADLLRNCFERALLLAVPLPGNKNAGFSP